MARTLIFSAYGNHRFTARQRLPLSRQAVKNLRRSSAHLSFHQSNYEGVLVDLIQAARDEADAIIINPAAYSFTSIAMLDALKAFEGPIIEVHISNIHARDELHRHSKLSSAVKAVICGLGPYGYIVAMQAALHMLGKLPASLPTPIRVGPR